MMQLPASTYRLWLIAMSLLAVDVLGISLRMQRADPLWNVTITQVAYAPQE